MKNMNIKKKLFFEQYIFFPMTSQGLRKVCVGEKARPQDILRPKSWFFESDKNDKKSRFAKEDELAKPLMGGSGGAEPPPGKYRLFFGKIMKKT